MMEHQTDRDSITKVRAKRGAGATIGIALLVIALIIFVLFATGFWQADVTQPGSLPQVKVSASAGQLPKVDVTSKEIVVGTGEATVEVPTVTVKGD